MFNKNVPQQQESRIQQITSMIPILTRLTLNITEPHHEKTCLKKIVII